VPAFLKVPLVEGDLIMTNYKLVFRTSIFPVNTP